MARASGGMSIDDDSKFCDRCSGTLKNGQCANPKCIAKK